MLIDSHCHFSKEYYDDLEEVLINNKKNGVNKIIISGCDKKSIKEAILLSNKYCEVELCLGYHPSEVDNLEDRDIEELEILLKNSNAIALGEIGLDYYYTKDNKDKQIYIFNKQLQLAEKLNLPVIIHSRDATKDTIDTLKKYNLKGVIHCFSDSYETALEYIKLGYLIGISGVITFKNSKLKNVVSRLKLENVVLETDSPYLSPEPYRGQTNSSKNILYIAEYIADLKNISLEEVALVTSSNVCNIYNLK